MLDELCFEEIHAEIRRKKPLWHLGIHQDKQDSDGKNIYSFRQYTAQIAGFTLELERKYDKFWELKNEEPEYTYRLKVKVDDKTIAKFYGNGKLALLFETCNKDR